VVVGVSVPVAVKVGVALRVALTGLVGVKVGVADGVGVLLAGGVWVATFGTYSRSPVRIKSDARQFAHINWLTVV
jgi:hypothetical protein